MASRTLLVVDGNSLTHRAFHSPGPAFTTSDGTDISAIRGFLRLLTGIIERTRPTGLIIGFDDARTSWRRDAWPQYKATRAAKPDSLVRQLALLPDLLTDAGLTVITPTGCEADDVLGAGAALAEREGWQALLATSDRDSYSLVTDRTHVFRLTDGVAGADIVTPATLATNLGIPAGLYLDVAAIRGDSSDNLPGVDGLGPKLAAAVVHAAGSAHAALDAAAQDPNAWASVVGPTRARRLAEPEQVARVHRNLHLMTIARDLPELAGLTCDQTVCRATPDRFTAVFTAWNLVPAARALADAFGTPSRVRGEVITRSQAPADGGGGGPDRCADAGRQAGHQPTILPAPAHDLPHPQAPTGRWLVPGWVTSA